MGQCCKIITTKQPFSMFEMSTKNLFDDMYLYLKEIYLTSLQASSKQMDVLNGLPKLNQPTQASQDYIEVTSQFWNLMHKPPQS